MKITKIGEKREIMLDEARGVFNVKCERIYRIVLADKIEVVKPISVETVIDIDNYRSMRTPWYVVPRVLNAHFTNKLKEVKRKFKALEDLIIYLNKDKYEVRIEKASDGGQGK